MIVKKPDAGMIPIQAPDKKGGTPWSPVEKRPFPSPRPSICVGGNLEIFFRNPRKEIL
tara:strand:- start:551 stop:724 length:174 start_codon:yes stop_codon:yes gene_type:complete